MKSLRCRNLFAVAVFVLFVAAASHVDAQVLDQVPSNAIAVLKVKNLSATNAKVVKMAKDLALDQFEPDLADPLGALIEKLHVPQGLNKSGEIAFVFFDPETSHVKKKENMVTLFPVTDYQAFLGNLKDVKEDAGIAEGESRGKHWYVAHWGDYAATSPSKSLVATKPAEKMKLSELAAKESNTKDAVVIANLDAIRTFVLPQIQANRDKILDELTKDVSKNEATKKYAPIARAMGSVFLDHLETFISDANTGVLGLDLADDGVATTLLTELKPDSDSGKTIEDLKGEAANGSLLAGLPNRKYYAFGGYAADPVAMQRVVSMIVDPIIKQLADSGEDGKQMADLLEALKTLSGALHSAAAGAVVSDGAFGQDSLLQIVGVGRGDAKEMKQAWGPLMKGLSGVASVMPQKYIPVKLGVDFKADAKTVDGVSFDAQEISFKADPNDPQAAQAQQLSGMILGPSGLKGVIGAVDDKSVVFVHGGADALISEAIAATKDPQDHLSDLPGVKAVTGHLPEKRMLEFYVRLDQIFLSAVKLASNFGLPVKVRIPPNLPPIGVAATTDGPVARIDAYIPSQLVQSVVAAGIEAYTNVLGGPGGSGGPGGL